MLKSFRSLLTHCSSMTSLNTLFFSSPFHFIAGKAHRTHPVKLRPSDPYAFYVRHDFLSEHSLRTPDSWLIVFGPIEDISRMNASGALAHKGEEFVSFLNECLVCVKCGRRNTTHTNKHNKKLLFSVNFAISTPSQRHKLLKFHKGDTTWLVSWMSL